MPDTTMTDAIREATVLGTLRSAQLVRRLPGSERGVPGEAP